MQGWLEMVPVEKRVPLSLVSTMWVPGEEVILTSTGLNVEFLVLLYLVIDWLLLKKIIPVHLFP